jgi:hypothetical protein
MMHEDYREMLALHALGALEGAERRSLESHLEGCASCSGELVELDGAATSLALLTTPIAPSPQAIERILAAPDARDARPRTELRLAPAEPAAVRSQAVREPRRWRPFVLAARLAVAAVVVLLTISQLNLLTRLDEAYRQIERMQEIGRFVTSPDVAMVSLWGTGTARGAHAKVAYDHTNGRYMLFSTRLPEPPQGERYQLWVISERIRPAGAFSPDSPNGVILSPPRGDERFLFAVSVEPPGEADEPAGQMLLMSGALRNPP